MKFLHKDIYTAYWWWNTHNLNKCMDDIATYTYLFMQYYTKYENNNITVNGLLAYINKSHVSSSGLYTGAATVART